MVSKSPLWSELVILEVDYANRQTRFVVRLFDLQKIEFDSPISAAKAVVVLDQDAHLTPLDASAKWVNGEQMCLGIEPRKDHSMWFDRSNKRIKYSEITSSPAYYSLPFSCHPRVTVTNRGQKMNLSKALCLLQQTYSWTCVCVCVCERDSYHASRLYI